MSYKMRNPWAWGKPYVKEEKSDESTEVLHKPVAPRPSDKGGSEGEGSIGDEAVPDTASIDAGISDSPVEHQEPVAKPARLKRKKKGG